MGAWIETKIATIEASPNMSHPVWVRGLKPLMMQDIKVRIKSHPVWVRGLKPGYIKVT